MVVAGIAALRGAVEGAVVVVWEKAAGIDTAIIAAIIAVIVVLDMGFLRGLGSA